MKGEAIRASKTPASVKPTSNSVSGFISPPFLFFLIDQRPLGEQMLQLRLLARQHQTDLIEDRGLATQSLDELGMSAHLLFSIFCHTSISPFLHCRQI